MADSEVKVGYATLPKMHGYANFGIPTCTSNNIGDMLRTCYEHSTSNYRQCDYYMPPFRGMKSVCHDRHKMVHGLLLILYDVDVSQKYVYWCEARPHVLPMKGVLTCWRLLLIS